jgi:hypothetical protein
MLKTDRAVRKQYRAERRERRVGTKTALAIGRGAVTVMDFFSSDVLGILAMAHGQSVFLGLGIVATALGIWRLPKNAAKMEEALAEARAMRQEAKVTTVVHLRERLKADDRAIFERAGWIEPVPAENP